MNLLPAVSEEPETGAKAYGVPAPEESIIALILPKSPLGNRIFKKLFARKSQSKEIVSI